VLKKEGGNGNSKRENIVVGREDQGGTGGETEKRRKERSRPSEGKDLGGKAKGSG